MTSFDPLSAGIDWYETYRPASLSKVDMYAEGAALECKCDGLNIIIGREAIARYWCGRFQDQPACELTDLRPDGDVIVAIYCVPGGVVQVTLDFDPNGKVEHLRCGPGEPACSRAKRDRYSWDLVCPVCGATGTARLSEDAFPRPSQLHFRLDELSDGFELSRLGKSAVDTEITCLQCGAQT